MPIKDITGKRFGRLVAIRQNGKSGRAINWDCSCDCGNTANVKGASLRQGVTKSCGCLNDEVRRKPKPDRKGNLLAYRKTDDNRYHNWVNMKSRCNNPNNPRFHYYGGKGVTICDRWDSFALFCEDMGEKPTNKHTIERIDNNGDYTPDNCKWATYSEQSRNTSRNISVTIDRIEYCFKDACDVLNISYEMARGRIRRGWSVDDALSIPIKKP